MAELVGPYRLIRLLGEGGMGQVWEALGPGQARVAVKLLRGAFLAQPRERVLFEREARMGLELDHPGLVKTLDVGVAEDRQPYLAMELLPGPTLKELGQTGDLSLPVVLNLAQQLLDALAYLHGRGVLHRDIKSGNVMLDAEGRPRLMDFGLTRFSDETSITLTGMVFGSPHYMSPEQGMGEELDARSDLFSLGVVLYELLAGQLPFRADHPIGVVYSIINEDAPPLRRARPELPEALDWVLARALAKRREDRYAEAVELAGDLRQIQEMLAGQRLQEELHLLAGPARIDLRGRLPLTGRDDELEQVQDWLRGGGEPFLFLGGEAGVGKTRLVREAQRGLSLAAPRLLVGRTQPGREAFAYQPWLEALRPLADELDEDELDAALGIGPAQTLLNFLEGERTPGATRETLFEALRRLLALLAERGGLRIWLEDFHRADQASLDLLAYLGRCPAEELPGLLVSLREEELPEDGTLAQLRREMGGEGRAADLRLERLPVDAVHELVSAALPDLAAPDRAGARLFLDSGGNPFILGELLENLKRRPELLAHPDPESWDLPLPERLQDLVGLRLSALDEDERELLDLAAVEGESFSAEVLAEVLGLRRLRVLRRLQRLQRRTGLIQAAERRFFFDHALVHRVLYEELGLDLRREYHQMVGEYLEEAHGDDPAEAAAVARHYLGAGQRRRALPFLWTAGHHARELYAHHEARRHLETGREEADLWWLENPTGEAGELRRDFLRELAALEATEGNYEESAKLYAGARDLLTPGLDDQLQAELRRLRGESLYFAGRNEEAAAELASALAVCDDCDRRERALILRSRARLESRLNLWDEALASCEEARLLAEDHPSEALAIRHTMGLIQLRCGGLEAARGIFEEVAESAEAEAEDSLHAASLANLGIVYSRMGEAERALGCLEESLALRRRTGQVSETAKVLTNLAIARTKRGELDRARELLAESQEMKHRIGDQESLAHGENSMGGLEERAGRPEEALGHFRRAAELHFAGGNRAGAAVALHNLGEVLLDLGRVDEAEEPLARSLEIREELEMRGALVSSYRARARWLAALDREAEAEAAFAEARARMDAAGREEVLRLLLGEMQFDLDRGRVDEVRAALEALKAQEESWPPEGLEEAFSRFEARLEDAG